MQDANLKYKAQIETKASKDRSDTRISAIATLDNDTTVEAFKFLNYCELAKSSRVSKRFRNLIRKHRHSLALLYVEHISMERIYVSGDAYIEILHKKLSPESYNEWIIRNKYLKQIPLEDQVAGTENAEYDSEFYMISAGMNCSNESNHRRWQDKITVFLARAELNHENWPIFQHFVCLITDPFIYICDVELNAQNNVLNLLAGAINQNRGRLQCENLTFNLKGNIKKFMSWIKNSVCCYKFQIYNREIYDSSDSMTRLSFDHDEVLAVPNLCKSRYDEELLDLFLTGAHCTSEIDLKYYEHSNVIVELVQKFMDLSECDECQVVESIESNVAKRMQVNVIQVLKRDYAKFIVREERDEDHTIDHTFEFINVEIGKKLHLTAKILENIAYDCFKSFFVLKVMDL